MPQDDPSAHRYMHCVDGKRGWDHWHDNGTRAGLENPTWEARLGEYVNFSDNGEIKLDLDSAIRLAYIHSPNHQFQVETLYLSALDVTTERFRLDAQFFGGYDVAYRHDGKLVPASLGFDSATQQYTINPPAVGLESNRATIGRPSSADPALQYSRRFATAGQLVAGFANSFVYEFNGPNTGLSASLLNFTFLQPLLRGAGRDIALEQLTFAERSLLSNLRAYAQFRQGFYTQIAVGEVGVAGPQRGGRSTSLQIFSGQGGVGGYVGLLQQLQQIRNAEDNLALQENTLGQLAFRRKLGEIDLVQVDQFAQSVEAERAGLLLSRNNFEQQLDNYKTSFLGLPPNIEIGLNDDLIKQFQLIDRTGTEIQFRVEDLIRRRGDLDPDINDPGVRDDELLKITPEKAEAIKEIQLEAIELMPSLKEQIDRAISDIEKLKLAVPARKALMDEEGITKFDLSLTELDGELTRVRQQFSQLEYDAALLEETRDLGPDGIAPQEDAQDPPEDVPPAPNALQLDNSNGRDDEVESNGQDDEVESRGQDDEVEPDTAAEIDDSEEQAVEGSSPSDIVPAADAPAPDAPEPDVPRPDDSQGDKGDEAPDDIRGFDIQELMPPQEPYKLLSDSTNKFLADMRRVAQAATLVQARARLESVTVDEVNIPFDAAFQIALANRLDFMNGRTALVDTWRLIQVNADALQSVLDFSVAGDIRSARNNPVSFRAPTSNLSVGVQFDAPLTRLVERNAYRESLINYQRSRRSLIQSHDALHQDLRVLLRQIEQLRANLEIQRNAVLIAIRRVDVTREALVAPVRPPQPGQRGAQFGPTAAFNLLSAQSALRNTQNAFLSAWLTYYAAKMRLARELGIMELDSEGRWVENELPNFKEETSPDAPEVLPVPEVIPPPIPDELIEAVNSLPEDFKFQVPQEESDSSIQVAEEMSPIGEKLKSATKLIPWRK